MKKHIIHLAEPASEWELASPIGCGSMGAMIFGDPENEKIYLTEESIWSGEKHDSTDPQFREKIDILRKMHLEGKDELIDEKASELLSGSMERIKSLEYAGLLRVKSGGGEITDYARDLDLNDGVLNVSFIKNGVKHSREAFSSFPDRIIAFRFRSDEKSDLTAVFSRENIDELSFSNGILYVSGHTEYGNHGFSVGIRFVSNGKIAFEDGSVHITAQTETALFISIESEFRRGEKHKEACLARLTGKDDFDAVKASHIADFSAMFNRSDIHFDHDESLDLLPIPERLQRLRDDENADDYALAELYFAFGKYLLISSSRKGTLPANLQGVWVEGIKNPWESDYHTNINLQMNYWPAEIADLGECHTALFDYMNDFLLPSGRETAKVNYRCRGTVVHHISDIYGFTTPAAGLWGIWPLGAAWLAYHMWEHYLYTNDVSFLRETAYEYIRDAALFFIDYMFEDNDGKLVTGPSMSPENRYYIGEGENRKTAFLAFSPAMDTEIVSGLLEFYIETERLLGISPETKREAERVLPLLPELKIGKDGRLMEWREDYDEPEPGHRHVSHAFALFPGASINEKTPELFSAVRKSLEKRLESGGGHTGWSRAWLISLFARLKDGKAAYAHIRKLFTASTLDNFFDTHPPLQIDGNFGGAAGIAETLLQSHDGFITLLPAVKSDLSGSFTGLKARGNIKVSATFKNGKVTSATFLSATDQTVFVRLPGVETPIKLELKKASECALTV